MAQAGPQGNTPSIPKFTGFRRKQASNPIPDLPSKDGEDRHTAALAKPTAVLVGPEKLSDKKENHKRRHHRHKDERREHHHRHKRRHTDESPEPNPVIIEPRDDTQESFFVDPKGDPSNITYKSLHKFDIPNYGRNGRGNVLGLPKEHKIDRSISDERQICTHNTNLRLSGRRDKLVFKQLKSDGPKVTLVQASTTTTPRYEYNLDYIGLSEDHSGRLSEEGATGYGTGSQTSEEETEDIYRFHEGRKKAENKMGQAQSIGLNFPTEIVTRMKHSSETEMRLKRAKLTQKTIEESANGQAWIELIDFEDDILYHGREVENSGISAAEKRSTADIKLSMYEKSLKTVLDPTYRERLILGMLREGSRLWDSKKITDKWHEALRDNPGYISLWIEFLNFEQTAQLKFKASDLQQCFKDCLQTLHRAAQTVKAGDSLRSIRLLQSYVLLRSTLFFREAGWADLSVGIWQANLELNFFQPPVRSPSETDESNLKASFEVFWESEVARIGEEGSVGWVTFSNQGGDPLESQRTTSEVNPGQPSNFNAWTNRERFLTSRSRMPARTGDDEGLNDPYRVIMYQDVAPFLVGLSEQDVMDYLVPTFLMFCHLPPPIYVSQQSRDWWADPFTRNENLQAIKHQWQFWRKRVRSDQFTSVPETEGQNISELLPQIAFPVPNFLTSSDSLFTSRWFDVFRSWKLEFRDDQGPVEISWILRTLKAIVNSAIGSDGLAEYLLAFESIASPQTVLKTAKAILKKRSSSLRLYNAYALIEYCSRNVEKAKDVLASTARRLEHLPLASRKEIVLLWRTRIWIALESEGEDAAWAILATFSHNGFNSAQVSKSESATMTAAVLRAQKAVLAIRSDLLDSNPELAAMLSEMLCLMSYSDPRNRSTPLEAYLSSFANYTIDHAPPPSILEHLHQCRAKLLYHHATHASTFRPSELRTALAESIRLFPTNTMFLSLYAWNEARFRVDDRVRAIVRDVITLRPPSSSSISSNSSGVRAESISIPFFSIYTELSRSLTAGSNIHSVRAAFERAVDSASCGSKSAALWKLYVLFEVNEGGDLGRAKTVFYRAVRAVPWAKEVYMLAFEELKGVMGEEELKGLVEWMVDGRGLRVFGAEGI